MINVKPINKGRSSSLQDPLETDDLSKTIEDEGSFRFYTAIDFEKS